MGSYDARYVVGEFSCSTANASPITAPVGTASCYTCGDRFCRRDPCESYRTVIAITGIIGVTELPVAWLQPLLERWMEKLRGYHKNGETAVMPGAKLADLVTKHMRTVFVEHRRALKNDVNYSTVVHAGPRLTMVPCQMQHGHGDPTIVGAQGLASSFHSFYITNSRRSAHFCTMALPGWFFLAVCKTATPPAAWPRRQGG